MKLPLYSIVPKVQNAWIAPNATVSKKLETDPAVVGEVVIRKFATVWYNTIIRGDINKVEIGHYSSIGDKTVISTAASLPTGMNAGVYIGFNVTIGTGCSLISCHIEDDVMIGDKAVICEGARIEKGAQIAPGSVVPPGRLIPAKQLWAGNPVSYVKNLNIAEVWTNYTRSYVNTNHGDVHRAQFSPWPDNYLQRESTKEDVAFTDHEEEAQFTAKNLYKGMAKYYA